MISNDPIIVLTAAHCAISPANTVLILKAVHENPQGYEMYIVFDFLFYFFFDVFFSCVPFVFISYECLFLIFFSFFLIPTFICQNNNISYVNGTWIIHENFKNALLGNDIALMYFLEEHTELREVQLGGAIGNI